MCGIAIICGSSSNHCDAAAVCNGVQVDCGPPGAASPCLLAALRARGPDFLGAQDVLALGGTCRLRFIASLLQLRGLQPGTAPRLSSQGHILCFNGEVFGGLDLAAGENDGVRLMEALVAATAVESKAAVEVEAGAGADVDASVPKVLSRLRGPWAVLFWDPGQQRLWFGRDVLGRRSLLVHFPDTADPRLLMSSVSELPGEHQTTPTATAAAASSAGRDGSAAGADPASLNLPTLPAAAAVEVATQKAAAGSGGRAAPGARVGPASVGVADESAASGVGSHGVGGGGDTGADGEETEPTGSDGYWTELAPGLYSISFATTASEQPVTQQSEAPPPEAVSTAGAQNAESGAGAGMCGAGLSAALGGEQHDPAGLAGPFRRLVLAGRELCVQRHGWRDPVLLQLEGYRRAERESATQQQQLEERQQEDQSQQVEEVASCVLAAVTSVPGDEVEGGAAPDSKAPSPESLAADAAAAGAGAGEFPACLVGTATAAAGEGTGPGAAAPSRALLVHPRFCPAAAAPEEELAHALLAALTAAMRVRCACIETRSPHPAAAYAAAAAAAATAPPAAPALGPQPSWRREDPLSFCVEPAPHGDVGGTAPAGTAGAGVAGSDAASAGSRPGSPQAAVGRPMGHAPHGAGLGSSSQAPVMILFSGGVDSVLLAALAHQVLPAGVPIDLSNVCFAGGGAPSPDREAARDALEELAAACPGRHWRLIEADATLQDVDRHRSRLLALLRPAHTVMDLNIGAALWLAAAGQGTLRLPTGTAAAGATAAAPTAGPQPMAAAAATPPSLPTEPGPSSGPVAGAFYGSAARVVLLGHGADEQCGGYGRHRTRFRAGGWCGLAGELEVDVRRLWLRNLGRDDRLVADWGREGRHPFLDEAVVALLLTARLDCILDPSLPPGQGDKRVLRRALQLLGLPRASGRVKRAIQFGSRIGKLANRRDFGSNRAANKKNAGGVALQDVQAAAASAAAAAWVKPAKGT